MTESTTPTPAAVAREIMEKWVRRAITWNTTAHGEDLEEAVSGAVGLTFDAFAVAGYTIAGPGQYVVDADDLEMAVEWMDQADNPWSGSDETREAWVASLIARDHLKDVIAAVGASQDAKGAS